MIRHVALVAPLLLLCACVHTLEIDNLPADSFTASALANRPLAVGVVNASSAPETDGYVEAVALALQLQASVARVIYPWSKGTSVDVVANVTVDPEYKGAGANFLVNWPGFLVFAPAWNGYKYRANPRTRVQLTDASGQALDTIDWQYDYSFHQADMGRTWTEVGWLEWSVIPLVAGFVFINYDTDQTPHFIREVAPSYGKQVADQIAQRLSTTPAPAPAESTPAP